MTTTPTSQSSEAIKRQRAIDDPLDEIRATIDLIEARSVEINRMLGLNAAPPIARRPPLTVRRGGAA